MIYCLEADGQAESQLQGCNCDFKKRRFVDVLKEGLDSAGGREGGGLDGGRWLAVTVTHWTEQEKKRKKCNREVLRAVTVQTLLTTLWLRHQSTHTHADMTFFLKKKNVFIIYFCYN